MEPAPLQSAGYDQSRRSASDREPGSSGAGDPLRSDQQSRRSRRGQSDDVRTAQGQAERTAGQEQQADGPDADPQHCDPPRVTYSVPAAVALSALPDPVAINATINDGYHAWSVAMTTYMGAGDPLNAPRLANWCTYGQHASREAGAQIVNLRAAMQMLSDAVATFNAITTYGPSIGAILSLERALPTLRRLVALLQEPGLVRQTLQLALSKAGITLADLVDVVEKIEEVLTLDWSDLNPFNSDVLDALGAIFALLIRLAVAVPDIITAVRQIHDNLAQGNREIYENIAPAYIAFLNAGLAERYGAVTGVAYEGDDSGFLAAAFTAYADVRRMANEMCCLEEADPEWQVLADQRRAKANEANLLIGYQEQLVILQPIFDRMQEELAAMDNTMVLRDPNGTHPLVAGWGDFYTRMGIDPGSAPADPSAIAPGDLPPLADRGADPDRDTIADYFIDNVEDRRIHDAPRAIGDH